MFQWIARRTQVEALDARIATVTERLSDALDGSAAHATEIAALSDRVATLDEHIGALRQDMDGRVSDLERRLDDIADRLDRTEDRTRRVDDERSGTADYLDRMILRYDAHLAEQGDAREGLRIAIARLERRFELQAEDTDRTAAALLARIERLRVA